MMSSPSLVGVDLKAEQRHLETIEQKSSTRRGFVPEAIVKKGNYYPVGPMVLQFFIFEVIGSYRQNMVITQECGSSKYGYILYYYPRKKVSYEPIDLDVIRDVDLNKLEPWDLKDRCRIGSGPQNEWYFFSRKDKKYPTGTRTNRATAAGFWKATGRDKAIHHAGHPKRIGMRKTLVFYIGRAPNGQKTDWIMHEYRLDVEHEHSSSSDMIQDEGWVVCRVFKKKTLQRGFHAPPEEGGDQHHMIQSHLKPQLDPNHGGGTAAPWGSLPFCLDTSMHLPQLLNAEATAAAASFMPPMAAPEDPLGARPVLHERFGGDWPLLDKLLASHQNLSQLFQMERDGQRQSQEADVLGGALAHGRLPYIGCEADQLLRFSR